MLDWQYLVRRRMKELGCSVAELARQTNISRRRLFYWFAGKHDLGATRLWKILDTLGPFRAEFQPPHKLLADRFTRRRTHANAPPVEQHLTKTNLGDNATGRKTLAPKQ